MLSKLNQDFKMQVHNYNASIRAMSYMPAVSLPYNKIRTQKYLQEMQNTIKLLKKELSLL